MSKINHYSPNHIPKSERLFNIVWAIGLVFIVFVGYQDGSFYLPGRGASDGVLFTGSALYLYLTAAVFGSINLLVTVIDHYDKRNNESHYKLVSRTLNTIAVVLVISSVSLAFVNNLKEPVIIENVS